MREGLIKQIRLDLDRKMVLLAGPRQVGKTTLAKQLLKNSRGYLNYDDSRDRENILKLQFDTKSKLWVFDELHKFRPWRNYLKGIYDTKDPSQRILVTGSAKLDVYRRGGDSLQGRYHFHRMYPLTVFDFANSKERLSALTSLLQLNGFPEPFLSQKQTDTNRWSREYRTRFIADEVESLETIEDLGSLEMLMLRLPDLVGSPLSINNLRESLRLAHKTVARYLRIFENLYFIFRISPFGSPKIKAIQKEQKHYHFDWNLIENEGPRLENFMALHLLRFAHWRQDIFGEDLDLRYFKTQDKKEVDFIITNREKPILAIEIKQSKSEVNTALRYLKRKYPELICWQASLKSKASYQTAEGIRVNSIYELFESLYQTLNESKLNFKVL